jgi:hypothetical protein
VGAVGFVWAYCVILVTWWDDEEVDMLVEMGWLGEGRNGFSYFVGLFIILYQCVLMIE